MPTHILGISAFYHDSAAALLVDGEIVAAAQEERFTRKKHDHAFPQNAVAYCLEEAGIAAADLDQVIFYDKPGVKFSRLVETYGTFAPAGFGAICRRCRSGCGRSSICARRWMRHSATATGGAMRLPTTTRRTPPPRSFPRRSRRRRS
ncbi:MAG: carbamoyltransferase N-terminal domain-containing protein [Verrucomicrobiales bacterium]